MIFDFFFNIFLLAGRVKEYYRYPALEAFNKGRVRRYFADVLYEMVDDPSTDSIVSWSQDGKSFIFWDQDKFCNDVLPKYGLSTSPTFIGRLHKIYVSKFRIEYVFWIPYFVWKKFKCFGSFIFVEFP